MQTDKIATLFKELRSDIAAQGDDGDEFKKRIIANTLDAGEIFLLNQDRIATALESIGEHLKRISKHGLKAKAG